MCSLTLRSKGTSLPANFEIVMKGSATVRQHFSYRCAQDTPSAQPNHLLHATSDTLLRLEQMTVASRTRARHSVAFWVFPDYWSATVWR